MMTFDTEVYGELTPGSGATVHQDVSIVGETPATAVLSNTTGAWGVRRVDTGDIVVAAETALSVEGGDYYFEFEEPEEGLEYEYCVKFTNSGGTYYYQGRINRRGIPDTNTFGTLGWIRKRLVDEGGYFDLVVDAENADYTDLGANVWINRACAWLDLNTASEYGSQRFYATLTAGNYLVDLSRCKRLHALECMDADGKRTPVEIVNFHTLRNTYGTVWTGETQGTPTYAAHDIYRHQHTSLSAFTDTADASSAVFETIRMAVMPPADATYTIIAFGDFKQVDLTTDSDKNYWTVENDVLLLNVCRMLIEESHDNLEASRGRERLVQRDLARMEVKTIWAEMGEDFAMEP